MGLLNRKERGAMTYTIQELARAAGCSKATVHRAINLKELGAFHPVPGPSKSGRKHYRIEQSIGDAWMKRTGRSAGKAKASPIKVFRAAPAQPFLADTTALDILKVLEDIRDLSKRLLAVWGAS